MSVGNGATCPRLASPSVKSPQQVEPSSIALGIEAMLGGVPLRLDGAVARLPNPNTVGAQLVEPGDQLNATQSYIQIFYNIYSIGGDAPAIDPINA